MPLVTAEGFVADRWRRIDDDTGLAPGICLLVPLGRLDEALAVGVHPVGVELPAGANLDLLLRRLHSIGLIALRFESFTDGRGFSLARTLRRLGFAGRLRASGHLIADQWGFLRECGIDEVEIDATLAERQPETSWRRAAGAITGSYQRRLAEPRAATAG